MAKRNEVAPKRPEVCSHLRAFYTLLTSGLGESMHEVGLSMTDGTPYTISMVSVYVNNGLEVPVSISLSVGRNGDLPFIRAITKDISELIGGAFVATYGPNFEAGENDMDKSGENDLDDPEGEAS